MACTRVRKKARTSCDYGWIEPNTGMPHTMQHAHSFATCFKHGALFKELAPFLVPLTSFMLVTTNWLMQDMVSRAPAPLRLSLSVREMVGEISYAMYAQHTCPYTFWFKHVCDTSNQPTDAAHNNDSKN